MSDETALGGYRTVVEQALGLIEVNELGRARAILAQNEATIAGLSMTAVEPLVDGLALNALRGNAEDFPVLAEFFRRAQLSLTAGLRGGGQGLSNAKAELEALKIHFCWE